MHTVWRISDPARVEAIAAAISAEPIVIADGHHRYETSLAYRDERRAASADGTAGGAEAVMCFVVELVDDELSVGPIHRLLSGLPDDLDLVAALEPFFTVEPFEITGAGTVRRLQAEGALGLVTADRHLAAAPPARGHGRGPRPRLQPPRRGPGRHSTASSVVYQHGVDHIRNAVAKGEAQAGVLLRPVTVAQILEIAHGGERMPPKSTFFFPKPRTGLVFRDLH